ncbi:peptidylprolyl isomerase [Thalassotalea sp. LPB0316]|uniref:peptidylprolyl isomerase n=1 Tax=Thalassotalea sp. LPB0316 TaxID=2769490 RepID=UPI0018662F48|nr:peptidylprolyl isomerase [Thalassotalea sp. LPB0316]QOL25744.1 peptidylprolyl isomerase [Thalassotalea sp. LPB0316]
MKNKTLLKAVGVAVSLFFIPTSYATIVDIETSVGTIQVNLFDQSTPKTVENFLAYVADDSYINTVIHRSVSDFVVQGGGFTFNGEALEAITTKGTVDNEPVWSNTAGTIAMAKVAGNPDSATSQWFFNVSNNSANLDNQNGGFTAFGQVVSGMDVVEEINGLSTCNDMPMVNYDTSDCTVVPGQENLVSIVSITIVDDATNTEENVEKTPTTRAPVVTPTPDGGSSSGGSMSFALLGLLGLARLFRK